VGFRGVGARVFLLFFRAVICLGTRPHQTKKRRRSVASKGAGLGGVGWMFARGAHVCSTFVKLTGIAAGAADRTGHLVWNSY